MQHSLGRSVFLACSLSFASIVAADAIVDPQLAQRVAAGPGPHEVIVDFRAASDISSLSVLGVRFVRLPRLAMAGALLTMRCVPE